MQGIFIYLSFNKLVIVSAVMFFFKIIINIIPEKIVISSFLFHFSSSKIDTFSIPDICNRDWMFQMWPTGLLLMVDGADGGPPGLPGAKLFLNM